MTKQTYTGTAVQLEILLETTAPPAKPNGNERAGKTGASGPPTEQLSKKQGVVPTDAPPAMKPRQTERGGERRRE
eukprot:8631509-Pyramimonas_sp.AAC.1